jgi:Family of unknown function (DUF6152)
VRAGSGKGSSVAFIIASGLFLGGVPVLAHHSFMAEFDKEKPVHLDGVVTKIEWINPHTYFYLDVKDASGKTTHWSLETGSPNVLMLRGWTRDTMKIGEHISVSGYRSKERPDRAAARAVTFPDGRTLFGGQTDDGGPAK